MLSSSPPSFSFNKTTSTSIKEEADNIQYKFTTAINSIKSQPSFILLSQALGDASAASARVTLPSMIHDNADVRAASHAQKDRLKTMFDEAFSDEELYNSLLTIADSKSDTSNNNDEDIRFQKNILKMFHRNGCGSTSDQATTIESKRIQIEETCSAFCAEINEHDGYLLFTAEQLDGVDDIDRFPKDENTKKIKIGLKAPSTLPLLKFAKSSDTRRQVMEALSKKCQKENTPRFLEVIQLRDECAKLLGYSNHAHYMCEVKMVGTPEKAKEFLLKLVEAYRPKCKQELDLLIEQKKKDIGGENVKLDPWDIAYYTRMYKANESGVDEQVLRQYFPLEHVKSTILSIYEELLGLKFERVDAKVWHEDVECFAVCCATEGTVLGHVYFDIFPRPGKYSHQCVYPLSPSYSTENGGRVLPACVNIGNLTPSREGASLLLFREVETFFHEFGHAMHSVLTSSKHSLHSWTWSAAPWPGGVEQDFLEVPSMMLENFVWSPEVLKRLSKHISDGSSLSEETIKALSKSRFLMTAYGKMKYLAMSLYDLKVHSGPGPYEFEGDEYDAEELYNVMIEKYTGISPLPGSFAVASWFRGFIC